MPFLKPISWSMAAILRDSVFTATVVNTLLREIQLTVTTMRNSMHGFPFLSDMSMGLRLVTLRAAKAPLKHVPSVISSHSVLLWFKFLQIVNCDKHVNIQLFGKLSMVLVQHTWLSLSLLMFLGELLRLLTNFCWSRQRTSLNRLAWGLSQCACLASGIPSHLRLNAAHQSLFFKLRIYIF